MRKIFFIFILIFMVTACNNENLDKTDKSVDWINKKVSERGLIKLYESEDNITIYSKLAKIEYLDNNITFDLQQALEDKKISIDDLIEKLDYLTEANDGGSRYYESNANFLGNKFYLAKCNSLEGNGGIKDIFIDTDEESIYDYCVIE